MPECIPGSRKFRDAIASESAAMLYIYYRTAGSGARHEFTNSSALESFKHERYFRARLFYARGVSRVSQPLLHHRASRGSMREQPGWHDCLPRSRQYLCTLPIAEETRYEGEFPDRRETVELNRHL